MNLKDALNNDLWLSHKVGDKYDLSKSGGGEWELWYYPIFKCGKTGEVYSEPRALWYQQKSEFMDLRESPLRYAKRICDGLAGV